ncbi:hypothetical protein Fmac_016836 [Flemingia macrophylla]|uniref:Uncharacterized protein n=1 Tax=Flemingia macrophylla TaxID=520843 RepID=A0ABD1MIH8_9FABA
MGFTGATGATCKDYLVTDVLVSPLHRSNVKRRISAKKHVAHHRGKVKAFPKYDPSKVSKFTGVIWLYESKGRKKVIEEQVEKIKKYAIVVQVLAHSHIRKKERFEAEAWIDAILGTSLVCKVGTIVKRILYTSTLSIWRVIRIWWCLYLHSMLSPIVFNFPHSVTVLDGHKKKDA